MPEVRNPGLGAGQQAMLIGTATLTAAQIRSLHAVPVLVLAAPGAGKIIVPIGIAIVYHFGSSPYQFPTGGDDQLTLRYVAGGDANIFQEMGVVTGPSSTFTFTGGSNIATTILPGADNQAISIISDSDYTNGSIATATLGAGGAGYAANDTGTITSGSGDATYKVLTVDGGGAVLTFQITGAGTSYAVGAGQATAVGGAQPGVGAGLTVNITAVNAGDGTLKVVTYYQIIPVP